MLHRLKAVASGYDSKPDWSAFGGHGASLGHVEVVVWFRWRLVLDVVNPHLIGHVAAAHNPVALAHRCYQSTPGSPRSHPPKGVGFPDPLSGTLNFRAPMPLFSGSEDLA